MAKNKRWQWIPTHLTLAQFIQFVLPHLVVGPRGPDPKPSLHAIFNYLLRLLYMGCQWQELPIKIDSNGRCIACRKPLFDPAIFEERFRTIKRVFAWEDKFKRLLLRFERISTLHCAFKALAYTMINLRHFCRR